MPKDPTRLELFADIQALIQKMAGHLFAVVVLSRDERDTCVNLAYVRAIAAAACEELEELVKDCQKRRGAP